MQMISHGFISGALFLCVGVLYDRLHSRQIADYGGVVNRMPVFAAFFMLFAMANSGLPGTSGFVGEFLVIMGAMKASFWYAVAAALTLIFGAAYTLWMYKRVHLRRGRQRARGRAQGPRCRASACCWGCSPSPCSRWGSSRSRCGDVLHVSVNSLLELASRSKIPLL